jgi:ribosome maturation factor RimP
MLDTEKLEELRSLASEVSLREGVELYDLEFVGRGRSRILRITIDAKDRQVSVDDCANVSRGLGLVLDVKDVVSGGRYELEVSSPGIERPLKTRHHFERAIGKRISFHSDAPVMTAKGERHRIEGELKNLGEDQIEINVDSNELLKISLDQVRKAKIVFETENTDKKRGRNGSR